MRALIFQGTLEDYEDVVAASKEASKMWAMVSLPERSGEGEGGFVSADFYC